MFTITAEDFQQDFQFTQAECNDMKECLEALFGSSDEQLPLFNHWGTYT